MSPPRHPAKWSLPLLGAIRDLVEVYHPDVGTALDPFCGVGLDRLGAALPEGWQTVGVELEPAWADSHPRVTVGDSRDLVGLGFAGLDAVISSPCYGNRMADSHEARERCSHCRGTGYVEQCGCRCHTSGGVKHVAACCSPGPCGKCEGTGVRDHKRNTYAHALREAGHDLTEGSAAAMHWGSLYRQLHEQVMRQCLAVLKPGGLIVWNVSNHMQPIPVERMVAEWHLNTWIVLGCRLCEIRRVSTSRQRQGANGQADDDGIDSRVDGELVMVLCAPDATRWAR